MNRPSSQRRPRARAVRSGFTLVELLMVIIVIAILMALLLPAIGGALRQAKRAAVTAEISQLAQALASFKSKYGDYPPSRFLAVESGNYSGYFGDGTLLNGGTLTDPTSPGDGDISLGQLAQRSVSALRKFWPRVTTNVTLSSTFFYDFNGDNTLATTPYILHGHECLVFFLGGIPTVDSTGTLSMTGFDKNPVNPFTPLAMTPTNRSAPLFEFNSGRLFLDPFSSTGIPGYFDSLGNATPATGGVPTTLNFYVYFSAYGNNGYDPNDVNFYNSVAGTWLETDGGGNGPIGLGFSTNFPVVSTKAVNYCESYAPNPYTSTVTVAPTIGSPVTFQSPQSFQIFSSGLDGLYGVGGQFISNPTSTAVVSTPADFSVATPPHTFYGVTSGGSLTAETDKTIRLREQDNLSSFKAGTLQ